MTRPGARKNYVPGTVILEKLRHALHAAVFRLPLFQRFQLPGGLEAGQRADITVIDPEKRGVIDPNEVYSLGRATPFAGWETTGDIAMTMAGGKIVWTSSAKS